MTRVERRSGQEPGQLTFRPRSLAFGVTNIIDALVIEHQVFLALFDEIELMLPRLKTVGEIGLACRILAEPLHEHGEQETNLIYIALDHVLLERHQLTRLNHDHHELDVVLKKVETIEDLGEARRHMKSTLAMARAHFTDEEENVFPVIERVLHQATLIELGSAWRRQRQLARRVTG